MSSSPTISKPARLTKKGTPLQVAHADEVGAVFDERDELLAVGLGPLAVGDVDAGRREKQHSPGVVPDRLDRDIGHPLAAVGHEVRQLGAKRLPRRGLSRRRFDLFHERRRGRPPRAFPERLPDDLFPGVAARFPGQAVRVEDRAVHIHDSRKQRSLLEKRVELGVRLGGFRQQLAFALLGLALARHVTHDLGRADHVALRRL